MRAAPSPAWRSATTAARSCAWCSRGWPDASWPETRAAVDPGASVPRLAEVAAWGVSRHDHAMIPLGSTHAEKDKIVARFKQALGDTGMGVAMATTNLFGHPAFKDGAF